MKIVITGANGYVGANLVRACLDAGHDVLAVDVKSNHIDKRAKYIELDIFNELDIYTKFENPDAVIHLAWRNGFVHNDISHLEDLDKHYKFLISMIDNGVKYISALGTMHEIGYYEGVVDEYTSCNPLSLYGVSKNALRQAILIYSANKNVNFSWLRGFYIVGDDIRSNSIFGKIIQAYQDGKKSFPLNSGKMKYDFIDIDEFCRQIMCATFSSKINGIINVCSGVPVSLSDRVEKFIIDNKLGIKLEYGVFPDRPYDSPIIYGDNRFINEIMKENNQ